MNLAKNFVVTSDDDIAVICFDVPQQKMNTLFPGLEVELLRVIDALKDDPKVKGIVFTSGKKGSFIAGADIDHITRAATQNDQAGATKISRDLSVALNALEALSQKHHKPVVAAIDGPCLGGGLELALACSGRIVTDSPKTVLGLPEVKLGLIPGGGGTQRLPRQVGPLQALDMILTGKNIRPHKARAMNLCDEVVPSSILVTTAKKWVRQKLKESNARGAAKKPKLVQRILGAIKPATWQSVALEKNPLGQSLLFRQAKRSLRHKTHGLYPAPEAAIEAIKAGLTYGKDKGLIKEAQLFGSLVVSHEAKALLGLYQATQALKKDRGTDNVNAKERAVKKVGVIGGGQMGGGIAWVTLAQANTQVRLKEVDDGGVSRSFAFIHKQASNDVRKKRISARDVPRLTSLFGATTDWDGFARADVIIEAVFEDLALKQRVLADVEAHTSESTIFASNTSSLPIGDIAKNAKRPDNVIGMHYFSPVEKMPLLEIITHPTTSADAIATCVALGKAQGKTVIVVGDGPGFYTTRILSPYLMEAAWLISEGAAIQDIDRALTQMGFAVGPVTLMDEVGLDTGAKVCKVMNQAFGERIHLPPGLDKLIADRRLGRKNGRGFYLYDKDKTGQGFKKGKVDTSVYALFGQDRKKRQRFAQKDLQDRIVLQMVNEAARCLEEKILRSPRDGDIGAIFGLGFAPYLGGPFRYVDRVGAKDVVDRLEALHKRYGPRFMPASVLVEAARRNTAFYTAD